MIIIAGIPWEFPNINGLFFPRKSKSRGLSINDITHLGGGGCAISLFSKMGDKGEGGVKNLNKWVTSFMDDRPLSSKYNLMAKCWSLSFSKKLVCVRVPNNQNCKKLNDDYLQSVCMIYQLLDRTNR